MLGPPIATFDKIFGGLFHVPQFLGVKRLKAHSQGVWAEFNLIVHGQSPSLRPFLNPIDRPVNTFF